MNEGHSGDPASPCVSCLHALCTSGKYQTEAEACSAFDEAALQSGAFKLWKEVPGEMIHPLPGNGERQRYRIDRIKVRPENMMQIPLTPDQHRRFVSMVYTGADMSPDETFRRSHAALRTLGVHESLIPAHRRVRPEDPEQTENPELMSWRRYCEWREQQEEKRRGRAATKGLGMKQRT